jgi:hypothetical protein
MDVMPLVRRFDEVLPPFFPEHPRPTSHSIARIESHFGITLPRALLDFARSASRFGCWFSSLGPDYDNRAHIIRVNSFWRNRRRTKRIPRKLVAFTIGFDDDLDCFDTDAHDTVAGEYEIRYWSPGVEDAGSRHASFAAYVESHIRSWEGSHRRA